MIKNRRNFGKNLQKLVKTRLKGYGKL